MALSQHNQSTKQARAEILSRPTTHERSEATIPYLLDVFADSASNFDRLIQLFAPWTWSTLDPDMAHALQDALQKNGVKPELCKVGVCTAEERAHLEAIRDLSVTQYAEWKGRKPNPVAWGDSTKCHGCDMSSDCFFKPLKRFAGCDKAFYHSEKCQEEHWKQHKSRCRAPATTPRVAAFDDSQHPWMKALNYLNKEALADPEAHDLRRSICIPDDQEQEPGLATHRLVFTGQDTPDKMRLPFGPEWEDNIGEEHREARFQWLLDPPRGSASYNSLTRKMGSAPSLVRSLRPATEAEKKDMEQVREMQALIRQRVGTRANRFVNQADIKAILQSFGAGGEAKYSHLMLAVGMTDVGIPS